jgi:hypothetical protein
MSATGSPMQTRLPVVLEPGAHIHATFDEESGYAGVTELACLGESVSHLVRSGRRFGG